MGSDSGIESEFDNRPTPLASRGVYLPVVYGRGLVAPAFCWTGDRITEKVEQDVGGCGMGGSAPSSLIYKEAAMQVLCLGPVWKLHRISQNGKPLYKTPISSVSTDSNYVASGSAVTISTDEGGTETFYIYWGENDQPVNTWLGDADRIGVSSRWPNVCYIVWRRKTLGPSPNWPNLEFEVETKVASQFAGSNPVIAEKAPGTKDGGLNPAHVAYHAMTAKYPHGIGMPAHLLNLKAFKNLGKLLAGERLAMNAVHDSGDTAASLVGRIMSDCSFAVPQIDGRLYPFAVRKEKPDTMPVFDATSLIPPDPEIRRLTGEELKDRVLFIYKNNRGSYRDMDIVFDDDGACNYRFRPNPHRIELSTITSTWVARRVIQRKYAEFLVSQQSARMTLSHAAKHLFSGRPFILSGVGQFRCTSVKEKFGTSKVEIEALLDQFSLGRDGYEPDTTWNSYDSTTYLPIAADPHVLVLKAPAAMAADSLLVLRSRAHEHVVTSNIYISGDSGTSYIRIGRQDAWVGGGDLVADIPSSTDPVDPAGISIDVDIWNSDIQAYFDPPGGDPAWQSGQVLGFINGEVFFVKNVEVLTATRYRLLGCIRAGYGTTQDAHTAGDGVFVIWNSLLRKLTNPMMASGASILVKSRPATAMETLDISLITPAGPVAF